MSMICGPPKHFSSVHVPVGTIKAEAMGQIPVLENNIPQQNIHFSHSLDMVGDLILGLF
jgi:hypothetical protein